MARPYTVNITNGVGSANVLSGDYAVTTSVNGYDNTTIDPNNITVDKTTGTYSFTVSATGSVNIHVSEDGTTTGTSVVGATFVRCDSLGNEYGSVVTSNELGVATFSNTPFNEDSSITIYYKQKSSDGEHEFDDILKSVIADTSSKTVEVTNAVPLLRMINLTDEYYSGLKIDTGTITLS